MLSSKCLLVYHVQVSRSIVSRSMFEYITRITKFIVYLSTLHLKISHYYWSLKISVSKLYKLRSVNSGRWFWEKRLLHIVRDRFQKIFTWQTEVGRFRKFTFLTEVLWSLSSFLRRHSIETFVSDFSNGSILCFVYVWITATALLGMPSLEMFCSWTWLLFFPSTLLPVPIICFPHCVSLCGRRVVDSKLWLTFLSPWMLPDLLRFPNSFCLNSPYLDINQIKSSKEKGGK